MTPKMSTPWITSESCSLMLARRIVAYHLADAYQPVMDSRLMKTVDERLGELVATDCLHKADRSAMARLLISVVHGETVSSALLNAPPDADRQREVIKLI